jgi:osmotically-inducible protein OsmY
MGIEGEYDQQGLAKRVAIAFDRVAELADIDTVTIVQDGSTIILVGTVLDRAVIDRLHQVASQVDGTKQVDVTQVSY